MKDIVKNLVRILDSKIVLYAVIAVSALVFVQSYSCGKSENERLTTYNRQLKGDLDAAETELQNANYTIGTLKSKLVSREDLNKRLQSSNKEKDKDFDAFVKKHNLQIKSLDDTIAKLDQLIVNGESAVLASGGCNLEGCTISYSWQDTLKRFSLTDPNILKKGNEIFKSSQAFSVHGEVWEQKDGSLQTRRLVLREVFKDGDDYKPVPGAKAKVVDSSFTYHNPPITEPDWAWTDLFRLRAIAMGAIEVFPNSGNVTVGLGLEFFTFYGFGVGSYTSLDFKDPENISQSLSIQYNPIISDTELNFGVFVAAGSPFAKFFDTYQFSSGLVFYLNN